MRYVSPTFVFCSVRIHNNSTLDYRMQVLHFCFAQLGYITILLFIVRLPNETAQNDVRYASPTFLFCSVRIHNNSTVRLPNKTTQNDVRYVSPTFVLCSVMKSLCAVAFGNLNVKCRIVMYLLTS